MAIYLKKFKNHTQYENYINGSGVKLPNVSICKTEDDVHYNPDPYAGHDYVEIGGIKWATMNVGANSIADTGLYFSWGDTQGYTASQVGSGEGQKKFGWADYKYCSGAGTSSSAMTKYNSTDGKTVLEAADDAVTAAWGGQWRMPTTAEYDALRIAVNTAWTADYQGSGVSGLVLTDKTDSSKVLFFPACGACNDVVYSVGRYGPYWSSISSNDVIYAYNFSFNNSGSVEWDTANTERWYGLPVRGVVNE